MKDAGVTEIQSISNEIHRANREYINKSPPINALVMYDSDEGVYKVYKKRNPRFEYKLKRTKT